MNTVALNDADASVHAAILSKIGKLETLTLVQILAVYPDTQTVDIQPLIQQIAPDGTTVSHGVIYGAPYLTLQGGQNAIILTPTVGDIGLCAFCSRDISNVIKTRAQSAPASLRKYDLSDGVYLGGLLNNAAKNFIKIADDGLTLTSTAPLTINAPATIVNSDNVTLNGQNVEINAPLTTLNGNLALNGSLISKPGKYGANAVFNGSITATGDVTAGSISLEGHHHLGVKSGPDTTGGAV